MRQFSSNTLGAIFMMLSMAGFVLNDTLMKLALQELNLFQAISIRGIFAFLFMGLLCWKMGGFRTQAGLLNALVHPAVFWRTIGEVGGTFFFLTALFNMPIANATAVLQVLPLTITLAAALFLGEAMGWPRYVAIVIGLLGVLLIIRPGSDGFNIYSFSALAATFFITLRDLATRKIPQSTSFLLVSFLTTIVILLLGVVGSLFQPWNPVSQSQVFLLIGAAAIVIVAYNFSILTMRHGDVSFVSPFRYSILIWALILGYFAFDDIPDKWAVLGACIVVGSGLFTFYRERKSAKNKAGALDISGVSQFE